MSAAGGGGAYRLAHYTICHYSTGTYTCCLVSLLLHSARAVCALIHALFLAANLSFDVGKLVQIEHALAAVSQGTTSLGIKGNVCWSFISAGTDKPILASYKWDRNRNREEILIHPCGRVRDRQSLCDMSEYRDRVLWNGARLSCIDR
jgi:hypothetical protein